MRIIRFVKRCRAIWAALFLLVTASLFAGQSALSRDFLPRPDKKPASADLILASTGDAAGRDISPFKGDSLYPPRKPRLGGDVSSDVGRDVITSIPEKPALDDNNSSADNVSDSAADENLSDEITNNAAIGSPPKPVKKPLSNSRLLSRGDALLYKKIFAYQARAEWKQADALIEKLHDYRLRGHILFQRYMHPTAYVTSFDELRGWLDMYSDLPGADRIYKLALAKMPKSYKGSLKKPPPPPKHPGILSVLHEGNKRYVSPNSKSSAQRATKRKVETSIRRNIARGRPTQALKTLEAMRGNKALDHVEYDELQALIANSYMLVGKLDEAQTLADAAANRSGAKVPLAGCVGGLVAWRERDYSKAARLFATSANSPYNSTWTESASAYWASRAYMRAGKIQDVTPWLKKAAMHPRTFYGLIATKALGWDFDFNWKTPPLSQAYLDDIAKDKHGWRAMALVAAGQQHIAEAELERMHTRHKPELTKALLAYTVDRELPAYAMELAESVPYPQGGLYDAALYPLLPWTPKNGYKIDRALIHALIRQESRFDPFAESYTGATGLMQLMPKTASYVTGNRKYRTRGGQHALKDPQINLDIGQRYVEDLMNQPAVHHELFSLVVAYNAGPGNLRKWKREMSYMNDDPLLFIESIPMAETRAFAERVMAYYWIYRMRLAQPTPSLQAVAEGHWARYARLDDQYTPVESGRAQVKQARIVKKPKATSEQYASLNP